MGALGEILWIKVCGARDFSQLGYPHIWRVKCTPLVDSQEYRDILGKSEDDNSLKNLLSTYKKELEINKAIVDQAKLYVPKSGYDVEKFYVQPTDSQGQPRTGGFTDADLKASSSRIRWAEHFHHGSVGTKDT